MCVFTSIPDIAKCDKKPRQGRCPTGFKHRQRHVPPNKVERLVDRAGGMIADAMERAFHLLADGGRHVCAGPPGTVESLMASLMSGVQ